MRCGACIHSFIPSTERQINYFEHHIGDYDADTAHLSWAEDMAYTRLIRLYYRRESAIPAAVPDACRLIRASSREQREAVELVLNEFFELADDGWHQRRCDHELAKYQARVERNREVGKLGGRPGKTQTQTKPSGLISETQTKPSGLSVGSKKKPRHNPLHTPDTIHQTPEGQKLSTAAPSHPEADGSGADPPIEINGHHAAIPDCPHREIIAAYGDSLPMLPSVRVELWNGSRAKALQSRWRWLLTAKKSSGERYATDAGAGIDWFRRYFTHVAKSDFLSGRSGKWTGCDLGWLVTEANFAKVVQGNYDNATMGNQQ